MHAYLLVGTNNKKIEEEISKLSNNLKSEVLRFPLQKIEDTRELSKFTKLTRSKKRVLLLENIESASTESLNAFLKSLEEPQENISFIMTSSNVSGVLPTIVSRSVVIHVGVREATDKEKALTKKLLSLTVIEKFLFLEKFRDRKDAINFLEGLLFSLHEKLKSEPNKFIHTIETVNTTLERIKKNANVNLQLTNMAIKIS